MILSVVYNNKYNVVTQMKSNVSANLTTGHTQSIRTVHHHKAYARLFVGHTLNCVDTLLHITLVREVLNQFFY